MNENQRHQFGAMLDAFVILGKFYRSELALKVEGFIGPEDREALASRGFGSPLFSERFST